jgi:hypothetical protein
VLRGLELLGAHEREDEIGEQPEGDGGAEEEVQHRSGLRGPAGIARHDGKEADADGEINDVHMSGPLFGPNLDTQSRVSSRYGIAGWAIRKP